MAAKRISLVGDKTVLREKRISDAANDYEWRADEELARLDAARPLRVGYKEFLPLYEEEIQYDAPWSRRFAIDTAADQRHIGNCMYYDINFTAGAAELGILIGDRDYWSRGYGTDAVDTLLRHIFTETPLNKVYLHTLEWNHRAKRSFEKSGFHAVKPVTRAGLHFIYMELPRAAWDERQGARQAS
jgi:RimJ/RimL family protein N-acetyltransferase